MGADEKNGGLWCSPIANTSSPTSSAFCAICTIASIRSASLGVSPRHRIPGDVTHREDPNCMAFLLRFPPRRDRYMRLHVSQATRAARLFRRVSRLHPGRRGERQRRWACQCRAGPVRIGLSSGPSPSPYSPPPPPSPPPHPLPPLPPLPPSSPPLPSGRTTWPVRALVRAASSTAAVATASHGSTGTGPLPRTAAANAG